MLRRTERGVDLQVDQTGSNFVLLRPRSRRGKTWIGLNLADNRLEFGGAAVVEQRYIGTIVAGALGEGLKVITLPPPLQ